jgi:hypothetical protein
MPLGSEWGCAVISLPPKEREANGRDPKVLQYNRAN